MSGRARSAAMSQIRNAELSSKPSVGLSQRESAVWSMTENAPQVDHQRCKMFILIKLINPVVSSLVAITRSIFSSAPDEGVEQNFTAEKL